MSKGSFRRALLEIDRELASVPPAGDVHALVAARRRIVWRLPALALAMAVAILLFIRAHGREPAHVAGFTIDAPASSWQTDGDGLQVLASSLDLDVPGFGHVVAERGARVAQIDGGIHVLRGRVELAVTHRPVGVAPALVRVSHGTIAVLGTRFTIEQAEHGGRVVLHEGRIRFETSERTVILAAGSSLTWPLAPIASTPAAPPAPAQPSGVVRVDTERVHEAAPSQPTRSSEREPSPPQPISASEREPSTPQATASSELDVDHVLAELANFRARRRFADAAALLERALTTASPTTTLERLSYELGEIRTYQLADPEGACRHWHSHRARFPQGRYTDEVAAAVRRLGCEENTP